MIPVSREPEVFRGQGDLSWLPAFIAEHRIDPHGVLHIGAHRGEEVPAYRLIGFAHITLVEPDAGIAMQLQGDHPDIEVLSLAVTSGAPGMRAWDRKANSHQSRLLPPNVTPWEQRVWVFATTLDVVHGKVPIETNVLVVDTSGDELDVLFSGVLTGFDLIVVETDDAGVYASPTSAVRSYLAAQGFEPVQRWAHGDHSYGDEAYVRVS